MRIGTGWDLHRLTEGRPLIIGGVHVPSPVGEDAHSDGDVLIHALIDALLGAAALDDIGTHFPPSDNKWKDADSRELLRQVMKLIEDDGYRVENADCTVILEKPRLGPFRNRIRENLAADLKIPVGAVSMKAKTHEKVDSVGEGRAIEAQAAVLLEHLEK